MTIKTTKIETLLAERGMTKAGLSENAEFPDRTLALSFGEEPVNPGRRAN